MWSRPSATSQEIESAGKKAAQITRQLLVLGPPPRLQTTTAEPDPPRRGTRRGGFKEHEGGMG